MTTRSALEVFNVFLRLGCTSFGGPVAHLGYFREEFVRRRGWLSEKEYADLVALCQFMPGPASSQVGLGIGLGRAGYAGALAAWLGFTLPSAVLLILFAMGIAHVSELTHSGLLQGLKVVAVAVVIHAVWGMARQLCPDKERLTLMTGAAAMVLLAPMVWVQMAVMVISGAFGVLLYRKSNEVISGNGFEASGNVHGGRRTAVVMLAVFMLLLSGLPLIASTADTAGWEVFDAFFRSGALVFGGGHVVLPLLQAEVVQPEWVDRNVFLAGYGAAQAVPGPLFTFAAFLGASLTHGPAGWAGGLLCLVAIFLPSFLLVFGVFPFWDGLRKKRFVRAALMGVNAGVVGLLLAALYQPVWQAGIHTASHFALGILALLSLVTWKLPPWLVVIACGVIGWLLF